MTERTWNEATWPMPRAHLDAIYRIINATYMERPWRKVIGIQVPGIRVNTDLMDDDWRMFGIDWVIASEPLQPGSFRLIYDKGDSTVHLFDPIETGNPPPQQD